jgi:sec-independent protein translocase protein TatB
MFDVGFSELVLLFVIGLLVLGPQKLPKVAAEIGKWVGRARRTATQLRRQLEREIELSEIEPPKPPPSPPPRAETPPAQPQPAEAQTSGDAGSARAPATAPPETAQTDDAAATPDAVEAVETADRAEPPRDKTAAS